MLVPAEGELVVVVDEKGSRVATVLEGRQTIRTALVKIGDEILEVNHTQLEDFVCEKWADQR